MTIQDDETLQMYLEESLEHLEDIENDLLAIEEAGADIDDELVNKVYRAAHSIKGGAGFMGLTNIKDLTHEMENILGKIRSREMVPTSDVINVLLSASDTLKSLMDNVLHSNDEDISEQIAQLKAVLAGQAGTAAEQSPSTPASSPSTAPDSQDSCPAPEGTVALILPGGRCGLYIEPEDVLPLMEEGKCVYLVEMLPEEDLKAKDKTLKAVIEEMDQTGVILGCNFELPPLDKIEKDWTPEGTDQLLFLFATILKPGDINVLFEIDADRIFQLTDELELRTLEGEPVSPPADVTATQANEETPAVEEDPSPADSDATVVEETKTDKAAGQTEKQASTASANAEPPHKSVPGSRPREAKSSQPSKFGHETSLRVHVSLLDQLMTLAGELVLSRNQLLQSMASGDQRGSEIAGQRIDLITSELQEAIMLTRMQSIGNVFNKFPRVVRDLARSLGKKVELILEGKEVELDKTIIEAIGDPLTHLVRNAVDHGIEPPDVRQRAGKSPVGQIYLKAYHEAGQVNIEISDDGQGIDGHKLAAKALEKGLVTEEQVKMMSEREKINLIFLPGFSTAEKVTDVSGRGVGMDVVKTNLDKLGGLIDIDSEVGKGSVIRIKLPLTLAIIPCQIVLTGGERYAIPQVNLEELLRIPADQIQARIERVGDAEVVRLRGNLLPLIKLSEVIGIEPTYVDPETGLRKADRRKSLADRRCQKSPGPGPEMAADDYSCTADQAEIETENRQGGERRYRAASALNIVVVSTGAMKYGLVVDELHDSEEIVVKPLGRDLKKCKGYAGATIMGDGRVALILDVANLAQMAGLTSVENSVRAAEIAKAEKEAIKAKKDKQSLLIFRSSEEEQFAAPLSLVERIEKIKYTDIEDVGGKRVIKYRGGSLPLFSIDEVAMVKPLADQENLLVIVFVVAGREIGLLAIGPVDAMEVTINIDGQTLRQTGIMGSAIINNQTTLLIDIFEIVKALNPEWFDEQEVVEVSEGEAATILFAEDSSFFRNQVKGSMEDQGYNVLEAEDGEIAWNLLQENADRIALVVTDIEMPNMDGFTLTKKIKESPLFSHLPVIALTTLAGEEDIAKGKEVGIDDYQIKLDKEKLLASITNHLKQLKAA